MEPAALAARGFAIGFAIAAAIGPIGLLCIRRVLAEGPAVGLASGLGAATADGLYAAVAAFGLTAISDILVAGRRPFGLVGGVFLVILAVRSIRRPTPVIGPDVRAGRGLASAYATTLGLTITNPATILSFTAAFVGFGLAGHGGPGAVALVLGVFTGSATWWVVLTAATSTFRVRMGPRTIDRLAAVSSAVIGAIGLLAVGSSLLTV